MHGRQLHKFGGSSLSNVKCYQRVRNIMAEYSHPGDLMVVSAAGTTTNQLISWLTMNKRDSFSAYQIQQNLKQYHIDLINGLFPPTKAEGLCAIFIRELKRLAMLMNYVMTDAVYAEVVGYGEIWSARLMAAFLNQNYLETKWLDARDFLRAERAVQPKVDANRSWTLLKELLNQHLNERLVITGFICRNQVGETVLLGRNGSDYSATQIGVLAGVKRITIWSDVAGIYSADPCKVKDACLLPLLHIDEANELARLAAPVLHTRTLQPIFGSDIDLLLRCSYQPKKGVTRIKRVVGSNRGVKIITGHDDVCLIELIISSKYDFTLIHNKINLVINHAQIEPLAVGIHRDRRLLQLCYTSEVVNNVFYILKKTCLPVHFQIREGVALVALVGMGVANNPLCSQRFYQQLKDYPVEFFWKAQDGISLVAMLSIGPTEHVVQKLHTSLFHIEKYFSLMLFDKTNASPYWRKSLSFYKKKRVSIRT